MKNYKVFYNDTEVAEFNTIKECRQYILEQVRNDIKNNNGIYVLEELFSIYSKVI